MKKLVLALAVTAAASQASAVTMNLISIESQNWEKLAADGGTAGYSISDISPSTATYDFDGTTLTSTGLTSSHWTITPTTILFDQNVVDLSIVMGGAASATSYECVEGNFGGYVGGNLCGNYSFNNYVDDSTLTYTGTSVTLVLGGDDTSNGDPQDLASLDNSTVDDNALYAADSNVVGQVGFSTYSWDGTTLKIHNMSGNTTQTLTFVSAIPVPAAAWLFGSALVGLAGVGRKRKMA
jgi:hypothetical protein